MSAGVRLPLAQAQAVAQEIVGQLAPACVRIEVAGSVRRGKADVGDIELVAVPRYIEEPSSLWGDVKRASVLDARLHELCFADDGPLERLAGGERYVKLRHLRSGLQVDLFLADADNYGLIYLIRTGPADYSAWFVTNARRLGFHSAGGRLRRGLCTAGEACRCEAIPTPQERDVYSVLGLPWVEPAERRAP